jgi:hypothetical protein
MLALCPNIEQISAFLLSNDWLLKCVRLTRKMCSFEIHGVDFQMQSLANLNFQKGAHQDPSVVELHSRALDSNTSEKIKTGNLNDRHGACDRRPGPGPAAPAVDPSRALEVAIWCHGTHGGR